MHLPEKAAHSMLRSTLGNLAAYSATPLLRQISNATHHAAALDEA